MENNKFWLVFISSTVSVEKIDFGKLIITLSNETENPLWYNYTDKGQNWTSFAYCHLNLFLFFICIDAWREVGCVLTKNNINYKTCCDYIWDKIKNVGYEY